MVIMTLEFWYIFKDYIIKSAYLIDMIDIVADNTHAKNEGRL